MEDTMKGNLYKSVLSDKIYLVEHANQTKGYATLVCMHFPYTRASVSKQSLKQYYQLITTEKT